MLSCEEVRKELPCVEAGEPAEGALRDHLAACEDCREEAVLVRAELDAMREDLAALAPSPFLEDAVVAAARDPASDRRAAHVPARRAGVAVALAAAAVLFAVLVLPGGDPEGPADGRRAAGESDPGGHGAIALPVPAAEVNAARLLTVPRTGTSFLDMWKESGARGDEFAHVFVDDDGDTILEPAAAIARPPGKSRPFRWVYRKSDVATTDRAYALVGVPPENVMFLGRELLARLSDGRGRDEKERVAAGLARVRASFRDKRTIDVRVTDPGGGATARLRVNLNEFYTGSLLLEEHVSRALGLHYYEIPGTVTLAGDYAVRARRAFARVQIPELQFDETIEAQVLERGIPSDVSGLSSTDPRLVHVMLEGERPDAAYSGAALRLNLLDMSLAGRARAPRATVVATRTVAFDPNSQRRASIDLEPRTEDAIALSYRGGKHPPCFVFLGPERGSYPTGNARQYVLERVTVPGRYAEGAEAVIGRVWRGKVAVPSRESVAYTTVDSLGRVSFVRSRGERGPLRMRIHTTDGDVRWYTFDPDPEQGRTVTLAVDVDKNGTITIRDKTLSVLGDESPRAIAVLGKELEAASRDAGWDGSPGKHSPLEILVRGDPAAPWTPFYTLFVSGARWGVGHYRLVLRGEAGAGVPFRLPVDRGLHEDPEMGEEEEVGPPMPGPRVKRKSRHRTLTLRVYREKEVTRSEVRFENPAGGETRVEGPSGLGEKHLGTLQRVLAVLSEQRAPKSRLTVRISMYEEDLGDVRYDEVRNLIVLLRQAGVDDVHLMSAIPKPRR